MIFLNRRPLFPSILLLIITAGCQKEPDQAPLTNEKWSKCPGIESVLGPMNSSGNGGQLYVLTENLFLKNISPVNPNPNMFHLGYYVGSGRLKFPVSLNYYLFTDASRIVIRSAFSDENKSIEKVIDLNTLDDDFDHFADIPYWQGECAAINGNNYLLVPYYAVKNGIAVSTPYFILVRIVPPESDDSQLEIDSISLIRQDIFAGITAVYRIQSFFNRFFVILGEQTYVIDTDGNIHKVSEEHFNIFQRGPELYALARHDLMSTTVNFYRSLDHGENWESLGEINEDILADFQYVIINERLVGYIKAQIFEVTLTDTKYSITELDNDGLGLTDITSISSAENEMVFITTRCNSFTTDCGGYFKRLEKFFEKKK